MSDSLQPCGLEPTRLLHPWDFPGKSSGVGCHSIQYSALESLTTVIRQDQEMKGSQIKREEIKLSLFADNTLLYIENPKHYTHTPVRTSKQTQHGFRI